MADHRGAYNLNYYVSAKMRPDGGEDDYIKAKIIDCRLKKGIDPKIVERTGQFYEYYLHF